jgi:acetyl-CoA acetyltransferase
MLIGLPKKHGISFLEAITALLKQCGNSIADIDLFEINEAFAVASIAVNRELGLNRKQ